MGPAMIKCRFYIKLLYFSGVDVSANQEEVEDTEIFQLEYNKLSDNWVFRTCTNKCWSLQAGGGVQLKGTDP